MTSEKPLDRPLVVFLDFDGVLNSKEHSPVGDDGFAGISHYHVKYLNEILEKTGACIVLTTSWRNDKGKNNPYEYAVKALVDAGVKQETIRGMVPVLPQKMSDYFHRGREIDEWLKENPSVKNYVILDDVFEFTKEQAEHLIQTDYKEGLRRKHVQQAIDILLNKAYS